MRINFIVLRKRKRLLCIPLYHTKREVITVYVESSKISANIMPSIMTAFM